MDKKTLAGWKHHLSDPEGSYSIEELTAMEAIRQSVLLADSQAIVAAKLLEINSKLKRIDDYLALHVPGYDREAPALANGRHER